MLSPSDKEYKELMREFSLFGISIFLIHIISILKKVVYYKNFSIVRVCLRHYFILSQRNILFFTVIMQGDGFRKVLNLCLFTLMLFISLFTYCDDVVIVEDRVSSLSAVTIRDNGIFFLKDVVLKETYYTTRIRF